MRCKIWLIIEPWNCRYFFSRVWLVFFFFEQRVVKTQITSALIFSHFSSHIICPDCIFFISRWLHPQSSINKKRIRSKCFGNDFIPCSWRNLNLYLESELHISIDDLQTLLRTKTHFSQFPSSSCVFLERWRTLARLDTLSPSRVER